MSISITTDQQVALTLDPISALGKPVPASLITGIPLWNSSNVNIASLIVASDGFCATVIGAASGSATINVIANAGTVAAPVQINGSLIVGVNQAPAASLFISASLPVLQ